MPGKKNINYTDRPPKHLFVLEDVQYVRLPKTQGSDSFINAFCYAVVGRNVRANPSYHLRYP